MNQRRTAAQIALLCGALAVVSACAGNTDYNHVAVNIPKPTPAGSTCTPVACADNNTTSTCPGSTHCFDGFCIDESCQQICVQSDGTQSVVPDDGGASKVTPCQIIKCGAAYCAGSGAACCSNACTDTATDNNNCGGCGIKCKAPDVCAQGSCNCGGITCNSWETCCTNACFDLYWDNLNCGACGAVLPNGQLCDFGTPLQGCYIAGVTYWPGSWDPGGTCGYCDPYGSGGINAWSTAFDGQWCSVGGGDVCVSGVCQPGCLVSSLPDGTFQLATLEPPGWITNGCFICNPSYWPNGVSHHPPLNPPACVDPALYPFPSSGIAGGLGGDGRFWVAGGWNWSGPGFTYFVSNQTWGFDPINNNWTQGPNMILQRQDAAGASAAGAVFVFGGLDPSGNPLAKAEVFDPGPPANPWVALPNLSTPRHFASAVYVASQDLIYVMGGENGMAGTPIDNIEVYQTVPPYTHTVLAPADTTGLLPPNPFLVGPTGQPALIGSSLIDASNIDGNIYAIGGYYPYGGSAHNAVWAYDVAGNSWSWAPAMGIAQALAGTVLAPPGNTIYEITGDNGFGGSSNDVQLATPNGSWASSISSPLYFRVGALAFYSPAPDNRIYLIGGDDWGWPIPDVEAYVLAGGFDVWIPQYPQY